MDEEPLVSYVICTFNSEEFIEDNLQSIKEQDYDNQEIIVVDNCSSDSTREIIEEKFPEVKLIVTPNSDYGACETFNIGFETAQGEYIAIMDDDVEIEEKWTKTLINKFKDSKENLALIEPRIEEKDRVKESSESLNKFQGCGVLVKKTVLEDVGYYNEDYFIYWNDVELGTRIVSEDYKIIRYPETTTYHKNSWSGDRELSNFDAYYYGRNHLLYIWQYYDRYNALAFTLHTFFKDSNRVIKSRTSISYLKGTLSAFKHFKKYWLDKNRPLPEIYRPWTPKNIIESIYRKI